MELFPLFSFKICLLLTGLVGTVYGGIIFVKLSDSYFISDVSSINFDARC